MLGGFGVQACLYTLQFRMLAVRYCSASFTAYLLEGVDRDNHRSFRSQENSGVK